MEAEKAMATIDPIIQNGELTAKAAFILGHILGAWVTFHKSHDLNKETVVCRSSDMLFKALEQYEKLMRSNGEQNGS